MAANGIAKHAAPPTTFLRLTAGLSENNNPISTNERRALSVLGEAATKIEARLDSFCNKSFDGELMLEIGIANVQQLYAYEKALRFALDCIKRAKNETATIEVDENTIKRNRK